MANSKNLTPFPKGKSGNPKGRPLSAKSTINQLVSSMYKSQSFDEMQHAYEKIRAMLLVSLTEKALENGGIKMHQFLLEKIDEHKSCVERDEKTKLHTASPEPEMDPLSVIDWKYTNLLGDLRTIERINKIKGKVETLIEILGEPEIFIENEYQEARDINQKKQNRTPYPLDSEDHDILIPTIGT